MVAVLDSFSSIDFEALRADVLADDVLVAALSLVAAELHLNSPSTQSRTLMQWRDWLNEQGFQSDDIVAYVDRLKSLGISDDEVEVLGHQKAGTKELVDDLASVHSTLLERVLILLDDAMDKSAELESVAGGVGHRPEQTAIQNKKKLQSVHRKGGLLGGLTESGLYEAAEIDRDQMTGRGATYKGARGGLTESGLHEAAEIDRGQMKGEGATYKGGKRITPGEHEAAEIDRQQKEGLNRIDAPAPRRDERIARKEQGVPAGRVAVDEFSTERDVIGRDQREKEMKTVRDRNKIIDDRGLEPRRDDPAQKLERELDPNRAARHEEKEINRQQKEGFNRIDAPAPRRDDRFARKEQGVPAGRVAVDEFSTERDVIGRDQREKEMEDFMAESMADTEDKVDTFYENNLRK